MTIQTQFLDDRPVNLRIASGALVFFRSPTGASALLRVAHGSARADAVTQSCLEVAKHWHCSLRDCRVKTIGFAPDFQPTLAGLTSSGVIPESSKSLVDGMAELWYEPSTHRLRLRVDALPQPEPAAGPKKVLVVDDSPTIRKLLGRILAADPGLMIVAETGNPLEVEGLIALHRPDVMTLDVHMPGMNGVELLRHLKGKCAVPTVMITSVSIEEGPLVLEALEAGALDYVQKPGGADLAGMSQAIVEKVKAASTSRMNAPRLAASGALFPLAELDQTRPILIGSSTGGTEALRELFQGLPAQIPPILVVQHIPVEFSGAFARRLDSILPFEVKEAEHGDVVQPGRVLIARGGVHMVLKRSGTGFVVHFDESQPVNRHCPSVDVLFESAAPLLQGTGVGVILTGMGTDGAKGLLALREAGCQTVAQDESTSVVYGMPREAVRLGAAEKVLPLQEIAGQLARWLGSSSRPRRHRDFKIPS